MSLPFENENKQVVKKLAYRSIKTQKRRNILTIITIFSAAFLMTLCGTVFASLFQIKANQGIDTYEAAFNNITEHNILELRALGEVAQVGEYYLYGDFNINNHTATMIYVDDDMIDIGRSQINLLAGSMPSDTNEIAVTQNYLNTLDESLHVGEPIEIALGNENKTFYLSGILQSPDIGMELYSFIVSKDYIKSQSSYNEKGFRAYVHLADANNISQEELAQAYLNISENLDLTAPSFNSAFVNYDKIPLETIMTISALALIILIGGSIVIHSIFRISVNERIHTYGQLRTIGATKRQIKGIVKREGVLVSAIGIPAGLLAGAITGFLILPKAFHVIGYSLVILIVSVISCMMVHLSINEPAKFASLTSPMEAVNFIPFKELSKSNRKLYKRMNSVRLAVISFWRDKKKAFSILLSLIFSGTLLLISGSLYTSYSLEEQTKIAFPYGDFKIYLSSDTANSNEIMKTENPFTEDLKNKILAIEGVKEIITVRKAIYGKCYENERMLTSSMIDTYSPSDVPYLESNLIEGSIPADGNYIISLGDNEVRGGLQSNLSLTIDSHIKELKYAGMVEIPRAGDDLLGINGAMWLIPEKTAQEIMGIKDLTFTWEIVTDSLKNESIRRQLSSIVNKTTYFKLAAFADKLESYRVNSYVFLIGQALSWFIFLFGVVNMINMQLSNQLSRKHEISIMRAVGMTQKQLYKMLISEGMIHIFLSTAIMFMIGLPSSVLITNNIGRMMYYQPMEYIFPYIPVMLYILILIILQFYLTHLTIKNMNKQTLLEHTL